MNTSMARPVGRLWARARACIAWLALAGMAACGGGGSDSPSASVSLSRSEVRLADSYENQQNPEAQQLTVNVSGHGIAGVGLAHDPAYPVADWVGAQITGTSSPYTVTIGLSGWAPVGEHTAHLLVGVVDEKGNALDVETLTVQYKVMARLQVNEPSLSFQGVNGAASPGVQSLLVGGTGLSWTATPSHSWIRLSHASGAGGSQIGVSVDDAGLASGEHAGSITIASNDGQSVTVPVTFQLTTTALTVSASSLTFGGANGRDATAQTLQLSLGTEGNAYGWHLQSLPSWLSANVAEGQVSDTPQVITLTPDVSALAPGQHSATMSVVADVNGDTITQEVQLTIHVDGRRLYVSEDGVAFTASPGWSRLSRTVTVKDNFGTATAWTAASDKPWLSVTSGGVGGGQLSLIADPASAVTGVNVATVTVRSVDSGHTPAVIKVGLWKSSTTPSATVTRTSVTYNHLVTDKIRPFVYVHSGGTSIDVYNPYTNTKVTTIPDVGNALGSMSVGTNGQRLYVVDNGFSRIAVVDLNTRRRTHFIETASPSNSGYALLAARVSGVELLLGGDRTVYRVSDGRRVDDGSGPMGLMAAGPGGERIYTQNTGLSPSGGGAYAVDYTTAFGGQFVSSFLGGSQTGSNGQDVAVAPDGSTVYTASGSPYRIQTFRGSDYSPIGELPEFTNYPNNVDAGSDGRVAGGVDGAYADYDIWVYSKTGAVQKRYKVVGYAAGLYTGTLFFTGDALMLAVLSDDNRMVFIPVGP
jgi:hypothetical protein